MDHIAVMKKSWGLTEKILSKRKTVESRWHRTRRAPWGTVNKGDTVYFKNSGEPVCIKAKVREVLQFGDLTPVKVKGILDEYGVEDGIDEHDKNKFHRFFKNRRYCILVFLVEPVKITPFEIDKAGFGMRASWISVSNIKKIRS